MKGFIYIFEAQGENGFLHKIGYSIDPDRRLTDIDNISPVPVRWVMEFEADNMRRAERRLHRMFANKRVRGEWFALDGHDICNLGRITHFAKGEFWREEMLGATPDDFGSFTGVELFNATFESVPWRYAA